MKIIYLNLLAFVFIINSSVFGQKMPIDYFDEGSNYYEAKDYKNALIAFTYIVKHNPNNELYPRAVYNTGFVYFIEKQYDSSIFIFKTILHSNFNEKEDAGGGIMDDPYLNYKHKASDLISHIYYKKQMYDSSLYYLALSDTLYPYLHFCGNELAENRVYTTLKYADIYMKLKNNDKAIASLLPAIFTTLADNSDVISKLKQLLKHKKQLKVQFDTALTKIYSKTFNHKTDENYIRYYIKFLGSEIYVPDGYEDNENKFNQDKSVAEIKKSKFYEMLK